MKKEFSNLIIKVSVSKSDVWRKTNYDMNSDDFGRFSGGIEFCADSLKEKSLLGSAIEREEIAKKFDETKKTFLKQAFMNQINKFIKENFDDIVTYDENEYPNSQEICYSMRIGIEQKTK